MRRWVLLALGAALFVAACTADGRSPRRDGGTGTDGASPTHPDSDGDGISDFWEGADSNDDTDGDGTPDYLDDDSDGDGVPDAAEGGVTVSGDEPRDTDGDGAHDYRDDDSDGNGILDAVEGGGDADGDGVVDSSDVDNDGDLIMDADEIGDPASPLDSDGDGTPDYFDLDSDGDTIGDIHEGTPDTDGDSIPDRLDLDSDSDGWTDAEEAGDADIDTPPVDTDGDMTPDYLDPDSDDDGLSDAEERMLGTSRTSADTDGDGITDLVEIAACGGDPMCAGDALDPMAGPTGRGDFVFLEPYTLPPTPPRDTLQFSTDLRVADVYFLMDTTGSMGGAITNLRSSLSGMIIPMVRATISDTWFGVGGFDDYPVSPYGSGPSGDRAYYHLQDITMRDTDAQAAVNRLTTHFGRDGPESLIPALYAVATGMGLPGSSGWTGARPSAGFSACAAGRTGWPCFRSGAVPVVVAITDVNQHNGPGGSAAYSDAVIGGHAPTYAEAVAAATAANIRVIGVAVRGGGRADLQRLATDTGAVDAAGNPLVTDSSSGGVSTALVDQIRTLANQTPIDVNLVFQDDASDSVDTWAAFMDHIEANTAGDPMRGCAAHMADDTDGDGFPDTFRGVTPGSPVCFDIVVKQNDTVMPTRMPQLFSATLRVLGDGFTELDSREIFFLVPPDIPDPGGPD